MTVGQRYKSLITVLITLVTLTACGAPVGGRSTPGDPATTSHDSTKLPPSSNGSATTGDPTPSGNPPVTMSSHGHTPLSSAAPTDENDERGPGLGTPMRIPLPVDTLLGRLYGQAKDLLTQRIIEACGTPEPCATVTKEVSGKAGEGGDDCYQVRRVKGMKVDSERPNDPWVEVYPGGAITLVVIFICEMDATTTQQIPTTP